MHGFVEWLTALLSFMLECFAFAIPILGVMAAVFLIVYAVLGIKRSSGKRKA